MRYEIKVPETGFSITEATIIEWHKGIGEKVAKGEAVVTVETDKVNVEIPAEEAGLLVEVRYGKDDIVSVGTVLGVVAAEEHVVALAAMPGGLKDREKEVKPIVGPPAVSLVGKASSAQRGTGRRRIASLARVIAGKRGIDLDLIPAGSGPGGRITKADVVNFIERRKKTDIGSEPRKTVAEPISDVRAVGEDEIILKSWRKVIADRMSASWREIPHHMQSVDVDVTDLHALLSEFKSDSNLPKVTYLPFIMKAIQAGIRVTPEINAYCFGDRYVIQKNLNIGVAVDVQGKLLVPVLKQVQEKSIVQIAQELEVLIGKARSDKLEPKDVQDGTITISNVGVLGLHSGFSIIVPPQTTIVCVGTVRDVLELKNGSMVTRKRMAISNSYDHRVVHGGPASRFFMELKGKLENVKSFLLHLR